MSLSVIFDLIKEHRMKKYRLRNAILSVTAAIVLSLTLNMLSTAEPGISRGTRTALSKVKSGLRSLRQNETKYQQQGYYNSLIQTVDEMVSFAKLLLQDKEQKEKIIGSLSSAGKTLKRYLRISEGKIKDEWKSEIDSYIKHIVDVISKIEETPYDKLSVDMFERKLDKTVDIPIGEVRLNTKSTFDGIIPLDAVIFMTGNDKYQGDLNPLSQCVNDVRLLSKIFLKCCRVEQNNIIVNINSNLQTFKEKFKKAISSLKKGQVFIFTYSGHGDEDGSLLMCDGQKFTPNELKKYINSFKNDTVMIIDACYSGNNEGPKEIEERATRKEYKENSIRIYASLAHQEAREISYTDKFFKSKKPFYDNVLNLTSIDGNGYFTAMVGLFFAEYEFKEDENISFEKLINYIGNKGNEYLEYLFARSKKGDRSARAKYDTRQDQKPKMLPIKKKPKFNNENNYYVVLQKDMNPLGLVTAVDGGWFFPIGSYSELYGSSLSVRVNIEYNIDFLFEPLWLRLTAGYTGLQNKSDIPDYYAKSPITIFPIGLGFRYSLMLNETMRLDFSAGGGMAFCSFKLEPYGSIGETKRESNNGFFYGGVNLNLEIFESINLRAGLNYETITFEKDWLNGIMLTGGLSYYF